MNAMKFLVRVGSTILLVAIILTGCAHKGPLLVDFSYQAPREEAVASKAVVAVSPFKDDRGKTESIAGKRFNQLNNQANELVVQGTVANKVTTALKSAFQSRAVTVHDVAAWDQTEAGIPANPGTLLVSGEIKNLWVETVSSLANTNIKATVELRLIIADGAKKKIIRTLNVSSIIERQSVTYTDAFVQSAMSEALSMALNRMFNDDELKSRLKE